jgi:putative transposase
MEGIEMTKIIRNEKSEALAKAILETYNPQTTADIQDAFKDIFGPIFESMLKGELQAHLGYSDNDHKTKDTDNRRNGTTPKTLKSTMGEIPINAPRDRNGSFTPVVIPKRVTDVSGIESKVLSMYAKGLSQRDIKDIIMDIYGFDISTEQVSIITDSILDELSEWQARPLKKFYTFMFVDCLYVTIRKDYETVNCAIYVILAYDLSGKKDILGLWIDKSENKAQWMQIFDEIKGRGVEDVLFISMDGLPGLEEGAQAIFPNTIIQRCIVHLIRNSLKYIPSKKRKDFCNHLKLVYKAPNKKVAFLEFEKFKAAWITDYPGAVAVWIKNWKHVEQLYDYTNPIRRIMYTTNAIESINSSFRKVTKKGVFPNDDSVYKVIYLRIRELYDKWNDRSSPTWSEVRNHLSLIDKFTDRISKYEKYEFISYK